MRSRLKLLLRAMEYRIFKVTGWSRQLPINITVSVTNKCNSRCKTCFLWTFYLKHPELKDREFTTDEFSRVFEAIGDAPFWFTMSGGEPFLRDDLPEICEAAVSYCKPRIINIPSNGLLPLVIQKETESILEKIGDTELIINLSLDGVGENHDEIRGVAGNFERLIESYDRLKALKKDYATLGLGIHSVISTFNIDEILSLYEYVKNFEPDSYITEIAEERTELFNIGKSITPKADAYVKVMNELSNRLRMDYLNSKTSVSKITQAFRLAYYSTVSRMLQGNRSVIQCYAGYASCQITPFGDVWPCCVLGYSNVMGNLRESNYDFKKIWFSKEADLVRKSIGAENCVCPLANAHYTNLLCNFSGLIRVLKNLA